MKKRKLIAIKKKFVYTNWNVKILKIFLILKSIYRIWVRVQIYYPFSVIEFYFLDNLNLF